MDKYQVIIYSASYKLCRKLQQYEPKLDRKNHCINIEGLNVKEIKDVKRKCNEFKVKYEITNENYERGSSYRRTFFSSNKPIREHYFCAYCGKYLPQNAVTVDHIIPVAYAKKNVSRQKLLHFLGINNINESKNLTPSCRSCNSRKGTKMGTWVLRGVAGKYQWLWIIRHIVRFSVLNVLLFFFYQQFLIFLGI